MKRFVLYSESAGVYVGNCMGMGFWSKWDAVGQTYAPTFETEDAAREHIASWDKQPSTLLPITIVPVEPASGTYASIAECVAAGLPAWEPR